MSVSVSDIVETIARKMCEREGRNPDQVVGWPESGAARWRQWEDDAKEAVRTLEALGIPASTLASLRAGEMVAVPRKLLTEAHACMRTCGWQLAPAAEQGTDDDAVLALAVADIEAQFGELLAAAQPRRDEGNG